MDLTDPFKASRDSMNDQGIGTLAGLTNLIKNSQPGKADQGTAKIPLALLPPGIGPGQRFSLTVTGVDPVTGTATVVPDAVQNAVPQAPNAGPAVPAADAVDKSITLGPMDAFKTFLFKQSQDQQENQQ